MDEEKRLRIALLAMPESSAATLYGMYDMFCSVGRDWSMLTKGELGPGFIETCIVSKDGEGFYSSNGAWIQPQLSLSADPGADVICIPDLMVPPGQSIRDCYPTEITWLLRHYSDGSFIATACTGALLLAEAGMLNGLETTTHWAYCEAMRDQYPRVTVRAERSVVLAGEGQRLLMAGGGTSWLDLALLVVARFFGPEEAMRLARIYLIDWHHMGQQPYTVLTSSVQVTDALMNQCQQWVASHYNEESPVAKMAAQSGLSDRNFARRFNRATGMSPLEYVHAMRLEEAKQYLEASGDSVEAIANAVGYEDAGFFSRLFRRKVGLTPAQYRKRFGKLRASLASVQTDSL